MLKGSRGSTKSSLKNASSGLQRRLKRSGGKFIAKKSISLSAISRRAENLRAQLPAAQAGRLERVIVEQRKKLTAFHVASQKLAQEVFRLDPTEKVRVLAISYDDPPKFLISARVREQPARGSRPEMRTDMSLRQVDNSQAIVRAKKTGQDFKAHTLMRSDMLTAEVAAKRVGKTRQTINDQRMAGRIIGLSFGSDRYRYPEWQFGDNVYGKPLEAVLKALRAQDSWEKWRFFTTEDGMLGGKTPEEALRAGLFPLERVIRAAQAFNEK